LIKTEAQTKTSETASTDKHESLAILDALSSHPATEARIQMVRDFEKQQKKTQ